MTIIKVQCLNGACELRGFRVETEVKVCLGCGEKLTSDLDVPFAQGPGRDVADMFDKIFGKRGW